MRRVLVVDDSPVACAILAKKLEALGASVVTRSSAREVESFDSSAVDAVLCDVDLGDGWGPDACTDLSMRVPVAFLTGGADDDVLQRARALGPLFDKTIDVERAVSWAMEPTE